MPSTEKTDQSVAGVLFTQTQRGLLGLFFLRWDESFYFRQIIGLTGFGPGAVQRELARWSNAGLLIRTQRGKQIHFQANQRSPVFSELRSLAMKTVGAAEAMREALEGLRERIRIAFIYGSMARGTDRQDSDVDVVVIGRADFAEVVAALSLVQDRIGRDINPVVYPVSEFRRKLRSRHHFVSSLLFGPKIYLVGNEDDFGRLGA